MAEYLINDTTLEDIADSIRAKDGTSADIQVSDYADRISNLSSDYDGGTFWDLIVGEMPNE